MYYRAELVLKNYILDTIAPSMFFMIKSPSEENIIPIQLWQIPKDGISQEGYDSIQDFFDKNGYPVKLFIIDPIDHSILASQEQIGWWDEGEDSDEYRDITLKDINLIFEEYEGLIEIEIRVDDTLRGYVTPILEEGKVIIKLL